MARADNSDAAQTVSLVVSEVEDYIRQHLPAEWVAAVDEDDREAMERVRGRLDLEQWWIDLAEAGYVTPTWPREFGGIGVTPDLGAAITRTLGRYRVPRFSNPVGVELVGPAILFWGTREQKERFLRPIARHQEVWCQLFSEPGAGSDLASLTTRAVRDGDAWVVNGQKLWTSLGQEAAFGLLLARTDPTAPKHAGITAFLVAMDRPGITVRPLRQMTGDAEFSEVFFDDALVDGSLRLGDAGAGWKVATSVLRNERHAVSGSGVSLPGTSTGRSVGTLIKRFAPVEHPDLRQRLAQAYIEDKVVLFTNQRTAALRRSGQAPGIEASIVKLFYSEHSQRLQRLAVDLQGPAGQAWEHDRWSEKTNWAFLRVRSRTIAGGTSEIQRNILGERVLGLPREPELDRDVPWSEARPS